MAEWLAAGLGWMINHIEQAFDSFIGLDMVAAGREWTEYDTRVLLRSAFKERIEAEARAVQSGIKTPNEARRDEGLRDKEHGDDLYMQQQMVAIGTAPPTAAPAPVAALAKSDTPPQPSDTQKAAYAAFLLRKMMDNRHATG